ncbi:DUF2442 domain-containing protein [Francisella tularensis]|uniref:DUF2442 domain-containing protein n=1 Tax=Francisella tularensis TaxID=263 RepID=UPI0008F4CDA6|nr:DUF2442 domain-containing protein [Francisella tularensis]APA83279.1 hypothetical protein N894_1295 [Francisella tularensis subsp. novicida PA10-7858]
MNILLKPLAQNIIFSDTDMTVFLKDGRSISVPLLWFPKLAQAKPLQLKNYFIMGDGEGIHWCDIDEDISVENLLYGFTSQKVI